MLSGLKTLPGAILLRAVGFRQPHGLRIILSLAARLDRGQVTFIPLRKCSVFVLTTCCAAYTCPKETRTENERDFILGKLNKAVVNADL